MNANFGLKIIGVVLAIGAIYLAFNGKDGWGWFLFGSILVATTSLK